MSNILVTGAGGFIGSHLVKRLTDEGHEVLALDAEVSHSVENVQAMEENLEVHYRMHDICEPITDEILELMLRLDRIYNAACIGSPPLYRRDPLHTFRTSTEGVRNLLEISERSGARFLQFSTSEVYGDPLEHPQNEKYNGNVNIVGPRSCYDVGKQGAETLCSIFAERGVETRIVRIFNTYGPRMNPQDGRVVSNFLMAALTEEPLEIYGDGKQTRSFCYIDDQVEGLICLMESEVQVPVNIGNPEEFTIGELAEIVKDITGTKSPIVYRTFDETDVYHPKNDPKQRQPDIGRAKELLRWEPKVSLEEGLRKTIPYFKEKVEVLNAERQYIKA